MCRDQQRQMGDREVEKGPMSAWFRQQKRSREHMKQKAGLRVNGGQSPCCSLSMPGLWLCCG